MQILNPATGELIESVENTSQDQLKHYLKNSRDHRDDSWFQDLGVRVEAIRQFRQAFKNNIEKGALITCRETGKPIHHAENEMIASLKRIDWFLEHISNHHRTDWVASEKSFDEYLSWEPLGTIGLISAWNYPYFVGLNVLIPALLTGNSVLYKPSEYALGTGRFMSELLHQSGVPEYALSLVLGSGDIGSQLCDLSLDGIFFTGSVQTGQKIAQHVAPQMMRIGIEAGGKDAAYVRADADIERTADTLASGAFYNSGQSCCGIERIYVAESVADAFIEQFIKKAKAYTPGNPLNRDTAIGPLARPQQAGFLDQQIEEAVKKGGELILKGGRLTGGEYDKGAYYSPCVVLNPPDDCSLMREESFGPVIGIQVVQSDESAIQKINDSHLGLTSSVHTQDLEKGKEILGQLNTGTVYLNNCDRVSPYLPWSGRKLSGIGSTLSSLGIRAFQQPKAWHLQKE